MERHEIEGKGRMKKRSQVKRRERGQTEVEREENEGGNKAIEKRQQ